MKATTKLRLPEDVVIAPCATLPPELNSQVDHEAGDFYVTRAETSLGSVVVDAQTALLLEHFRAPATVIDAVIAFCHANRLDPRCTLDDAFTTLTDLVAAQVLMPVESSFAQSWSIGTPLEQAHFVDEGGTYAGRPADGTKVALKESDLATNKPWQTYRYYEIYRKQFSEDECREVILLHHSYPMVDSKISKLGIPVRDCNLFWIPRNDRTEWIFARLWRLTKQFNEKYHFELAPHIGVAQLTRYKPGQHFDWHMDLGAQEASLRKISVVLQLSANKDVEGGSLEIFYNDSADNRVHADIGDAIVFPSFVMHRASIIRSGVRWSLVIWLTGSQPLR